MFRTMNQRFCRFLQVLRTIEQRFWRLFRVIKQRFWRLFRII